MIPVFAVETQGNPVFDLEKEDMTLYVNGKPRDIAYFKRYDFETSTIEKDKEQVLPEEKERVVFIIVDTMFNSNNGFKRSKDIAGDIVKQGKPGDQFVVFENTIFGGLKHIAGPADSRENLLKKIGKLKRPIEKWASQLLSSRDLLNNIDFSIETEERLETEQWHPSGSSIWIRKVCATGTRWNISAGYFRNLNISSKPSVNPSWFSCYRRYGGWCF